MTNHCDHSKQACNSVTPFSTQGVTNLSFFFQLPFIGNFYIRTLETLDKVHMGKHQEFNFYGVLGKGWSPSLFDGGGGLFLRLEQDGRVWNMDEPESVE